MVPNPAPAGIDTCTDLEPTLVAPGARVPRVHVTTLPATEHGAVQELGTYVTPAGRVSVSCTPVAEEAAPTLFW